MHSDNDVHAFFFLSLMTVSWYIDVYMCVCTSIYTYTHIYTHTRLKTLTVLIVKRPFCAMEMENKQEDIIARQN